MPQDAPRHPLPPFTTETARAHGNENREFDEAGYMGRRPDNHNGLSDLGL